MVTMLKNKWTMYKGNKFLLFWYYFYYFYVVRKWFHTVGDHTY